MTKISRKIVLVLLVIAAALVGTVAQTFGQSGAVDDNTPVKSIDNIVKDTSSNTPGAVGATTISTQIEQLQPSSVSLRLFKNYTQANYVAAGIGVRNTGRGTISLRLPDGATMIDTWLYWKILNTTAGVLDKETIVSLFSLNF